MDPRVLNAPFRLLPAWIPFISAPAALARKQIRVSTPNATSVVIPTDEQIENAKLQIQKRHQARTYEEEHLRGMHVAGFMDYDPKIGARNAYRVAMKSGSRRDNDWFHL